MENKPQNTPLTENKMGVMPVGRLLVSMSVPMMISMLVQDIVVKFVDSVIAQAREKGSVNLFGIELKEDAFVGLREILADKMGVE